jgi:hypothetical protein
LLEHGDASVSTATLAVYLRHWLQTQRQVAKHGDTLATTSETPR